MQYNVETKLKKILEQTINDEIDDSRYSDISIKELDSIQIVNFFSRVEEEFGVELPISIMKRALMTDDWLRAMAEIINKPRKE